MTTPPASCPASATSRRPSCSVFTFDQGKNSIPSRAPTPWAWTASSANLAAQRQRSQGPSSPSGVTLMCRAPRASATSSTSCRTRSDSARRGPSSHQYGIPSSSRCTIPLSASMARIPLNRYSATAAGRSSDSRPKPRKPADDAASIRSRSVSGLRRSGRSEAASPAEVQQVARSSSLPAAGSSCVFVPSGVGCVDSVIPDHLRGQQGPWICGRAVWASANVLLFHFVGDGAHVLKLQVRDGLWEPSPPVVLSPSSHALALRRPCPATCGRTGSRRRAGAGAGSGRSIRPGAPLPGFPVSGRGSRGLRARGTRGG